MENKLTHLKYRQAVKNHDKLILTGVQQSKMDDKAYHASRAEIYNRYEQGKKLFEFVKNLEERKSYNPTFPLSVLLRLMEQKCGVEPDPGVVIAVMLARGFKCNWDKSDPRFNISSTSPALA